MRLERKQYRVDKEDLGEIACAFIIIGYHALRYDRVQKEAEESFGLLYTLCKKRIDQNCSRAEKRNFIKPISFVRFQSTGAIPQAL